MTCFNCQCSIAVRLMVILLGIFTIHTKAEGQGMTRSKWHMIPGKSVSPQLEGKVLQVLFDGVADLYYQTDGITNYYYITDIDGRLFTISVPGNVGKNATWSGRQGVVSVLKVFMNEVPGLHERIDLCEFARHDLTELMQDYHIAVTGSEEGIVYELPPPALVPHISLFAGFNVDMLNIGSSEDFGHFKLDPALFPSAGISFRALLPRVSKNFSISLDLSAGKRYGYGFYSSPADIPPATEIVNEFHMHNFLLFSGLRFIYNSGNGRIKPFVSAGFCARTIISDNSRIDTDVITPQEILSDTFSVTIKEKTSMGLNASSGLSFAVSGKISLSTGLIYSELFNSSVYNSYRSFGLVMGADF